MRWVLAVAAVLVACGPHRDAVGSSSEAYASAVRLLREGNLQAAGAQAKANAEKTAQSGTELHWQFRLLESEVLLAAGDAKAARQKLEALPAHPEFPAWTARCQLARANAAVKLADYAKAHSLLATARETLRTHSVPVIVQAEADVIEGLLLTQEREYALARERLLKALPLARQERDAYWEAAALINLGFDSLRQSRHDEAIPYLEQAMVASTAAGAQRLRGIALLNLGICRYHLGDFDQARSSLSEAVRISQKYGDRRTLQASLGSMGNLYMLENQPEKAAEYFQKAFHQSQDLTAFSFSAIWAGNLSRAAMEAQKWDEAKHWNETAKKYKLATEDRAGLVYNSLNSGAIAAGLGRFEEAQAAYTEAASAARNDPSVLWEVHAGRGQLFAVAGRHAEAGREYETALKLIESSRQRLLRTEYKLTWLTNLIRFYQAYVELLLQSGQTEKALDVVESSRAQILLGEPSRLRTADYRTVARKTRSTVLSYWLAPNKSSLWVITPTTVRHFDLPPAAQIDALVRSHRGLIRDLREPLGPASRTGDELFRTLLGPALPWLGKDAPVTLVPDGSLHALNFETLPVQGQRYWIQDAAIAVMPSLRAAFVREAAGRSVARSLLLIGDPDSTGAEFPKLRHAAREMSGIERSLHGFSRSVYRGASAYPNAYRKAQPDRFAMIHFTTHADANAESPLESAVVLSRNAQEFKLYASEIATIPLSADLVTISSCRSAGARSYVGEGLVGLAWAFLHAGSRNVIAGLWDVNDDSTAELMESLYAELAQGTDLRTALRRAKLRLIQTTGNLRKPYYWGPFLLYTRGS